MEQIFDRCEAYPVNKLLEHHCPGGSSLTEKTESPSDTTDIMAAESEQEAHGKIQSSSLMEKDEASQDLDKQSSETQGASASSQMRPKTQSISAVEPNTKVEHSADKICSKLESFLKQRDISAEAKLKELFAATQSNTAKENLLLSLR